MSPIAFSQHILQFTWVQRVWFCPICQLGAPFGPLPKSHRPEQCLKVMAVGNCGAGNVIKPFGTQDCVPYLYFSTHSAVPLGSKGVVLSKVLVGSTFWSTPLKPVDGRSRAVFEGDASGQLRGGKSHQTLRNLRMCSLVALLNTV